MSRKNSPVLLVRADASQAIGAGHVMRCLALAKAWQGIGGTVRWLLAEKIDVLKDRLTREQIACLDISVLRGSIEDAEQTASIARGHHAEWVAVDGYCFGPDYIRTLKMTGHRVLFLDDEGRFDFYPADVVLNQNISATPEKYSHCESLPHLLLGPQYVLLRPEFRVQRRRHDHPIIAAKVLVTMGGSDPENVTERVLRAVRDLILSINVVVGGGDPRYDTLSVLAKSIAPRVQLVRNPENMAPLMQWADAAISAAGSTCWELAYLGLPAIVIPVSRDQEDIAMGLAEHGVALNLGWHANLSEEAIRRSLSGLLLDHQGRVEMSVRGRHLIDGQGAARVVQFLQNCA